jgi:hypothetical protein
MQTLARIHGLTRKRKSACRTFQHRVPKFIFPAFTRKISRQPHPYPSECIPTAGSRAFDESSAVPKHWFTRPSPHIPLSSCTCSRCGFPSCFWQFVAIVPVCFICSDRLVGKSVLSHLLIPRSLLPESGSTALTALPLSFCSACFSSEPGNQLLREVTSSFHLSVWSMSHPVVLICLLLH